MRRRLALVAAVVLLAANLRPTITAVGPLIAEIGEDTGLTTSALGLITSIPLLAWAAISPFSHRLSVRFGMDRTVFWSLILLLLGTAVRSLPGQLVGLWVGTALVGVALAIINVLIPAVVKRDFPDRIPLMTGLYTALLAAFAAISSGAAVPISLWFADYPGAGWRMSLLITGALLLPAAIAVWGFVVVRGRRGVAVGEPAKPKPLNPLPVFSGGRSASVWRDAMAWHISAFMAFQSAVFYMMITWLPSISIGVGRSASQAGADVMYYQVFALVGSVSLPLLLRKTSLRFVGGALPVLGLVATGGLMFAPEWVLLWGIVMGLCSGSSLTTAFTLVAQRARDPQTSSALSGMSQSVGYLVAAAGPVAFSWLHNLSGSWSFALVLFVICMIGQAVSGIFAGGNRYVLDTRAIS